MKRKQKNFLLGGKEFTVNFKKELYTENKLKVQSD